MAEKPYNIVTTPN